MDGIVDYRGLGYRAITLTKAYWLNMVIECFRDDEGLDYRFGCGYDHTEQLRHEDEDEDEDTDPERAWKFNPYEIQVTTRQTLETIMQVSIP